MKIYLVRHGDSNLASRDDDRSLSEKGIRDINHLLEFVSPFRLEAAHIVHSLKYRTQQTAKILAKAFVSPPHLESFTELDPAASTSFMIEKIHEWNQDILIVGHMPFLNRLISQLVTRCEENEVVLFKPGCMVALQQLQYDHFAIMWMIDPALL